MANVRGSGSSHTIDVDFLTGGTVMAELVRCKDWSETPLGPIDTWPQSLRTTVSLCLASNFPINIIWGAESTQIYNDGYRIICGDAHPSALGQGYDVTWASAWPAIGAPFERAWTGETSFLENQRMFLTRNGYLEETFFTFSLSPIRDESGGIGGLFHPVTETTPTMLAERRTRALRDLTSKLGSVAELPGLVTTAIDSLSRFAFDLPFLLVYERSGDGRYASIGQYGVPAMSSADEPPAAAVLAVARGGANTEIDTAELRGVSSPCGPYPEVPSRAFVLPVGASAGEVTPLVVVAGISTRLPLDDAYRGFFELLGSTLSAALATVRLRAAERRRADELAEIDRAKTQFFSNVSHEFRTPLTLMLGPLEETLREGGTLAPSDRERIEIAFRNGQRLLRLVNSLLDFARIEAGRAQARVQPTDIVALTTDLVATFRSACEQAGLALVLETDAIAHPVLLDAEMWETIVLNLLSNAFKFTFQGEIRVSIRMAVVESSVEVSISDTGTGISAEALPHLFERFFRVEKAQGRSFEGSGIGLALVQELVAMHGGQIRVASQPGRGSTFTISLPTGAATAASSASNGAALPMSPRTQAFVQEALRWLPDQQPSFPLSEAPVPRPSAGRVLLADDNADMRSYVQRLLTAEGFIVEACPDGVAALDAARRQRPDLILTDIMMPHLDGFGLLKAVREDASLRDVPCILLSARAGEEARVEGIQAGADDYLTKPFSARELAARVAVNLNLARDRREAALRALNSNLERQVIERSLARGRTWQLSPDLMGVINAEGYFESSNPAWQQVLGLSEAEVAQSPFLDLIHPDDLARTLQVWEALTGRDEPAIHFENRYRHADGGWRWLSWVAVPQDGKVYCSARDITDAKQQAEALATAEDALRQSQKMEAVGQLTGGLAHDFNNLLTGITGSLELLGARITQGRFGDVDRYVMAAQGAAKRAAALTHRLLAFSRRQTLDPKPTNVNRLVIGLEEMVRRTMGPEITVEVVAAGGLWPTLIDPGQLENALLNLCINARDAMPNGGRLTIETGNKWLDERAACEREVPPAQYVTLSVSDTGSGMTPDVIRRAFDPFYTTKPIGLGTGLGLSMVYGFARQSGGLAQIYSEIGKGSVVCLYLPRHFGDADDDRSSHEQTNPVPATQSGTVLVVDDEPTVRMLVVDVLEELGYAAIEAGDGAAGLDVLRGSARIDLLVSDVGLPGGMNGRQLVDAAREIRPDLKVLFITGYAENAVLGNGFLEPGMHVLTKPFAMQDLANRIQTIVNETLH